MNAELAACLSRARDALTLAQNASERGDVYAVAEHLDTATSEIKAALDVLAEAAR
jgi:hypothetical protein